MNRSMVRLIQAEGFFPEGEVENYRQIINNLKFEESLYGLEVSNFNLVLPHMEPIFSKVIGERVKIDSANSGVFRKPDQTIHFESFDSLDEWRFIVALEPSTFNIYYHTTDARYDDTYRQVNAKTVLDGYQFNYKNLFEWDYHTNILLEPNQGLFYRPWIFHSLEKGLIQSYRLLADKKFRILITGLPGSLKSELANLLNKMVSNSVVIKSSEIRKQEKDIDFSFEGRMRHSHRMLELVREKSEDCVIIDMVCPLPEMREYLNADIIIWANDTSQCKYEEFSYIPPKLYDFNCKQINEENLNLILQLIESKRL